MAGNTVSKLTGKRFEHSLPMTKLRKTTPPNPAINFTYTGSRKVFFITFHITNPEYQTNKSSKVNNEFR